MILKTGQIGFCSLIEVKIWWKNNFNPGNGLHDSGAEEKDIKTGGKELDTCDSYSWVPHPREKHQFLCLRIFSHEVLLRLLFGFHFLCLQKLSQFSISLFADIFSCSASPQVTFQFSVVCEEGGQVARALIKSKQDLAPQTSLTSHSNWPSTGKEPDNEAKPKQIELSVFQRQNTDNRPLGNMQHIDL